VNVHPAAVAVAAGAAAHAVTENDVVTGILRARTAGDLGTLLGSAHLRLHAITVIFQGKIIQLQYSYSCTHSIFFGWNQDEFIT